MLHPKTEEKKLYEFSVIKFQSSVNDDEDGEKCNLSDQQEANGDGGDDKVDKKTGLSLRCTIWEISLYFQRTAWSFQL